MLKLNLNPTTQDGFRPNVAQIRDRLETAYERIAGSDDYQRNDRNLRLIQVCVVTVSALATGYVNAFAHQERLGWMGAGVLALLIMGFVEKFYFTLRHGLATTYKSGRQRLAATFCYRVIQATMILNAAVLCAWVAGVALPGFLRFWYQWSIAVHFALALLGVSAVRDSDAVVENRMRELKAEAAPLDILSIRKAAASGNWLVLIAARLRGLLDGVVLAKTLLRQKAEFPAGYLNAVGAPNDPVGKRWAEDGADEDEQGAAPVGKDQWAGGQPRWAKDGGQRSSTTGPMGADWWAEDGGQEAVPGPVGTDQWAGGQPAQVISLSAAHRKSLPPVGNPMAGAGGQSGQMTGEQAAEWLKGILPEASNGWWEVRAEGDAFAIKFRWRDPDRQTLSFPRMTAAQFKTLRESNPDLAGRIAQAQIAEHLLALSLNPAKCGKAVSAAQRLGIALADQPTACAVAGVGD